MLNNVISVFGTPTAASTNSYESIATVTVGAGGSSSITFSSIPSTYKHLQIRAMALGGNVYAYGNYNGDTGANYTFHNLAGDGASATAGAGTSQTRNFLSIGVSSSYPQVFVTDILDYANTNKYKTVRSLSGTDTNGGTGYAVLWSGAWLNTSAINSIVITPSGGTWNQYSSFALYGIKG